MLEIEGMKVRFLLTLLFVFCLRDLRADEQIFGFVRGAETLPAHRSELYQFLTLHEGKAEGTYYAWDSETEYEYGFTDRLQANLSIEQNYLYNQRVDGDRDALDNKNDYCFQGVESSAKYRVFSPFKDPLGVALRLESGYLLHDEVDGLKQHDRYLKPEVDFQKDFLEDRLICDLDFGAEWAWGKQRRPLPPKPIPFARNWFAGLEIHSRWEYPRFDFYNFEHRVFYAGPSIIIRRNVGGRRSRGTIRSTARESVNQPMGKRLPKKRDNSSG